jgi:hypothetical protein
MNVWFYLGRSPLQTEISIPPAHFIKRGQYKKIPLKKQGDFIVEREKLHY